MVAPKRSPICLRPHTNRYRLDTLNKWNFGLGFGWEAIVPAGMFAHLSPDKHVKPAALPWTPDRSPSFRTAVWASGNADLNLADYTQAYTESLFAFFSHHRLSLERLQFPG